MSENQKEVKEWFCGLLGEGQRLTPKAPLGGCLVCSRKVSVLRE